MVQDVAVGGELLLQDVHLASSLNEQLLLAVDRNNLPREARELLLAGCELPLVLLAMEVHLLREGQHVAALLGGAHLAGLDLLLQGCQAGLKGLYMGGLRFEGIGELSFFDGIVFDSWRVARLANV